MNHYPRINPEELAYWFFRLNGCTTVTNFVVHPDQRGSQRTDVDVLAVRFPFRCELLTSGEPMRDHEVFNSDGKVEIILAEVKHGLCSLNGPWTRPQDENMHRVLYAIGAFPPNQVSVVADSLYHLGVYVNELYRVRLFAIGSTKNPEIFPVAVQLLWEDILSFIHERFNHYRTQKSHHGQWYRTGRLLYRLSIEQSVDEFTATIKQCMQNQVDEFNQPRRKF